VPDERAVIAECIAEIGFATTVQADLLQSYLDTPLSSCHVRSVLADNRHLVEISGASWLASRARLAYMRNRHLGEIDSLQLLTDNCAHPTRMVRVRPLISADASTRFACSCCLLQPDITTVESASASRRHVPGPVGCAPTRCGNQPPHGHLQPKLRVRMASCSGPLHASPGILKPLWDKAICNHTALNSNAGGP